MLFFITPHSSQGFSYTFSPTFTFSRFCDPFFFLCLKPLAHSLLMASMLGGLHSCSHSVFPDWANVGLTGLVNDTFAAILIRSPTELEERRPQGCRAAGLLVTALQMEESPTRTGSNLPSSPTPSLSAWFLHAAFASPAFYFSQKASLSPLPPLFIIIIINYFFF